MSGVTDRLARRLHARAARLEVPELPDPDVPAPERLDFARVCGITADPWQVEVLASTSRKVIMCCSRQAGKSTVSAVLALHEAMYVPGSLVLLLSPSLRQSSELFRTAMRLYRGIEDVPVPAIAKESTLRVEFEQGSRIVSLPGSEQTTRGYAAATLVIIDEASRVPDELIGAVRPTLATTGGRLVALSTPAGRRGAFWRWWSSGEDWQRALVRAEDVPRITPEFLADERRELGEFIYSQEYECEFLDPTTSVFSTELIQRALSHDVQPLWGNT